MSREICFGIFTLPTHVSQPQFHLISELLTKNLIRPAASALGHLYSTMLVNSQNSWLEGPSGNGFTVAHQNLVVTFYCKEQAIGWDFVANFSRRLLALTQEGWTGLYRLMLSHAESGVTVEVSLRIVEEGYID